MSLRVRVNLLLSALFLLTLALGTLLVIESARRAVLAETESTARLALQLLDVALGSDAGDAARLRAELAGLEGARHLEVSVIAPGEAPPPREASPRPADAPEWFVRLVAPPPVEFRRALTAGSVPLEIVVRADPADEIGESWRDARAVLGLVLAFSLAANGLLSVTLGRWLRPIERIVGAMDGIEQGDYRSRLPAFGLPELSSLAAKFNRMAEALEQSREQNRRLAERTLASKEEERRALARELHDELGQSVSAIKALAVAIEQGGDTRAAAGTIAAIAGDVYDAVRGIMRRLRPVLLDEFGLVPALEELVDGWNERHPEAFCRLTARGRLDDLGAARDIHLYRIVQECLTNASKHAGATAVEVRLERRDVPEPAVVLEVRDDGRGFDPASTRLGLGLLGMRERVEALSGRLELDSGAGRGTTVRVAIPLAGEARAVGPSEAAA